MIKMGSVNTTKQSHAWIEFLLENQTGTINELTDYCKTQGYNWSESAGESDEWWQIQIAVSATLNFHIENRVIFPVRSEMTTVQVIVYDKWISGKILDIKYEDSFYFYCKNNLTEKERENISWEDWSWLILSKIKFQSKGLKIKIPRLRRSINHLRGWD